MFRGKQSRKSFAGPHLSDLRQRASLFDRGETIDAMDTMLSNIMQQFANYRRTRDFRYLGEIKMNAEALYALADGLLQREPDDDTVLAQPEVPQARQTLNRNRGHY